MATIDEKELEKKAKRFSGRKKISRENGTRARHYNSSKDPKVSKPASSSDFIDKKSQAEKETHTTKVEGEALKTQPNQVTALTKDSKESSSKQKTNLKPDSRFQPSNTENKYLKEFANGKISKREFQILSLLQTLGADLDYIEISTSSIQKKLNQKSGSWIPTAINNLVEKNVLTKKPGDYRKSNEYKLQ